MKVIKDQYYVIVTKYGFIYSVEEDYYTDIDENHEYYCFYNVQFTDSIKNAKRFRGLDDDAPKYAVSKLYNWENRTLENWTKEIDGELILVDVEKIDNSVPSISENGILELYEKTSYKLGYSDFLAGDFPKEYFDSEKLF